MRTGITVRLNPTNSKRLPMVVDPRIAPDLAAPSS
jgi:hypothetical protein